VDLTPEKLDFARRFGATDFIDASTTDPVAAIKDLSGGVDLAFDAFGSAATISQCVDSVRNNGVAVMVGLAPDGERAPIELVSLVRNQKQLMGSYYGSANPHATFARMLDFYLRGQIDVAGLITRRYPLAQINEGFDDLLSGKPGRGVLVMDSAD
jgi:S-(hydroxymethyl)glutathione dehydrogenase / alcohol dehydrogenase